MPLVIDLSKDKIVIVRIAVAIAISTILGSAPEMDDMFREAVANLKQDELDVREYFDWFVLTTIRDPSNLCWHEYLKKSLCSQLYQA